MVYETEEASCRNVVPEVGLDRIQPSREEFSCFCYEVIHQTVILFFISNTNLNFYNKNSGQYSSYTTSFWFSLTHSSVVPQFPLNNSLLNLALLLLLHLLFSYRVFFSHFISLPFIAFISLSFPTSYCSGYCLLPTVYYPCNHTKKPQNNFSNSVWAVGEHWTHHKEM